jgi:hypothetical protein
MHACAATPPGDRRARQRKDRRAARTMLALLLVSVSGCVGTTGHIAAVSTRELDAAELLTQMPARHVVGRSCIDVVVVFPLAMPNVGDAVADALRQSGGRVLTDVTIRYEILYMPFVYGVACFVAEGDAR